jgi:putative (di)nucleoside polyphosphate hydrolase
MIVSKLDPASLPYRPCVGLMVLNSGGKVFLGKRIDQSIESWQMPQGGIDEGESPRETALRELEEEIGTTKVEFLREHPDWLTYDLPPQLIGIAWQGRFRGQKLKWFAVRFLGADADINVRTAHQEFSDWQWADIEDVLRLIVPFKRETYAQVIAAFADLAGPV